MRKAANPHKGEAETREGFSFDQLIIAALHLFILLCFCILQRTL